MTADGLVSFAAGEGFKITGKGSHAFRAGARVGHDVDLGGSVTASNSAGVHLDYALRGQTTTEVIKGNNGTAMISITASDVIEMGGGLDVKIGVSPDVSEILEREAGKTWMPQGQLVHWRQILRGMRLLAPQPLASMFPGQMPRKSESYSALD